MDWKCFIYNYQYLEVQLEVKDLLQIRNAFNVKFNFNPHNEKMRSAYDEDIKVSVNDAFVHTV